MSKKKVSIINGTSLIVFVMLISTLFYVENKELLTFIEIIE